MSEKEKLINLVLDITKDGDNVLLYGAGEQAISDLPPEIAKLANILITGGVDDRFTIYSLWMISVICDGHLPDACFYAMRCLQAGCLIDSRKAYIICKNIPLNKQVNGYKWDAMFIKDRHAVEFYDFWQSIAVGASVDEAFKLIGGDKIKPAYLN